MKLHGWMRIAVALSVPWVAGYGAYLCKRAALLAMLALVGCTNEGPTGPTNVSSSKSDTAKTQSGAAIEPDQPSLAANATASVTPGEKAWIDCVYKEIRQREVLKPPTGTIAAVASTVTEQCRRFYVGPPGYDEFFVHTTVSGLRLKPLVGPAREPRPVVTDKRPDPRGDIKM